MLGLGKKMDRGPVKLELKHHLATRWFHWINFPMLAAMIWSGLLIYWSNDIYRVGFGDKTLVKLFPQSFYDMLHVPFRLAEGMAWHFLFMWLFAINGLLYVAYTLISGQWRELIPGKGAVKESILVILHDLKIYRGKLPPRKYNAAQQIAYTQIIIMGFFSLATGLAIYRPTQFAWLTALFGGYMITRFIHFWLTVGYCLFFVIHVGQVIKTGWNNFRGMITGYELVPTEEKTV